MSRVDWIQRGEYKREPCPRLNPCTEHQVALLHNLTNDGVEHVGYFILCDSLVTVSWLAWNPHIAVWDKHFRRSMGGLRRD